MNKKLIGGLLIALVIAGGAWFYLKNKKKAAVVPAGSAGSSGGGASSIMAGDPLLNSAVIGNSDRLRREKVALDLVGEQWRDGVRKIVPAMTDKELEVFTELLVYENKGTNVNTVTQHAAMLKQLQDKYGVFT